MEKTTIIAEAGVNHNGDIELAKKMVDAAKFAGADIIKFQAFVSGHVVTRHAKKADYQIGNLNKEESQLDMIKRLELSFSEFAYLNEYCQTKGIEFMATAFDFESIEFLSKTGITNWKIPSGEITNLPYLIKIARLNKPVILSTGMCTLDDVRNAVKILKENGIKDLTVLHCTTEYPAPYADVNLRAMCTMRDEFRVKVGYSDHTIGVEVSIAAVALGARVIEKHFTLDKNMEGPDHKASLEPNELKRLVDSIRHLEVALGDGVKKPAESEKKNISVARKSIVAARNIIVGEMFTEKNLAIKRPGTGISPMKWFDIIGKISPRDFEEDELIEV